MRWLLTIILTLIPLNTLSQPISEKKEISIVCFKSTSLVSRLESMGQKPVLVTAEEGLPQFWIWMNLKNGMTTVVVVLKESERSCVLGKGTTTQLNFPGIIHII